MGDHRCSIKIEMEFHGVKDELDGWYNWCPGIVEGVDNRVIEFIQGVYERGMAVYRERMDAYFAEQHRDEIEAQERRELARLKTKYEQPADKPDGGTK